MTKHETKIWISGIGTWDLGIKMEYAEKNPEYNLIPYFVFRTVLLPRVPNPQSLIPNP
jgi:hypothetical protein